MYHLRLKGDHYQMGVKRGKIFQKSKVAFPLHLDEFQLNYGKKSEQTMKTYDAANGNDYHSTKRYQTVMDSFSIHMKGNLIEATEQLLKGNYGFICQYDDEPDFETIWSSVFDLKNLMICRSEGDPRKKKFLADSRLHDIV